jgi:hypothetical protein
MKNNWILKSAIAASMGAAALSANAGTFNVGGVAPTPTILATEIFGAGSEETLITSPTRTFTPAAADVVPAGGTVTIKFTLGGGAVFGEVLNTPAAIAPFFAAWNGAVAVAGAINVSAGGAIGDNTVTIQFTPATPNITNFTFGGYKAKRLNSPLSTSGGVVQLGVNYTGALAANANDSAPPTDVFTSLSGVTLTIAADAKPVDQYINVAGNSKKFTLSDGAAGLKDFKTPGKATIHYGTAKLASGANVRGGVPVTVLREDLSRFVFQGGDAITLTLTGGAKAYKAAPGKVWLDEITGGPCDGAGKQYTGAATDTNVVFTLTGSSDDELNKMYDVCFTADGATEIEETTFDAKSDVNFFNIRYVDGSYADKVNTYGALKKNGVTQTVPYALSDKNPGYQTYLRVVNTGSVAGKVNVNCRKNGGGAPTNGNLIASLAPNDAKLIGPAEVVAACGANGPAAEGDFAYVRVIGEFDAMDAIQFVVHKDGTVVQFNTNNLVTGGEGGNN